MGRGWLQRPTHWSLFPGVPGPWCWELRRASWPLLGTVRVLAVGTWFSGADEMFLTTVLAGQALGTRRARGKRRRGGERRWCFPVQPWELRNASLGKLELLGGVFTAGFCHPEIAGSGWAG